MCGAVGYILNPSRNFFSFNLSTSQMFCIVFFLGWFVVLFSLGGWFLFVDCSRMNGSLIEVARALLVFVSNRLCLPIYYT